MLCLHFEHSAIKTVTLWTHC